jgi:hypothetical protein
MENILGCSSRAQMGLFGQASAYLKKLSCKCTFKDSMRFPIHFSFVDPGFAPEIISPHIHAGIYSKLSVLSDNT